MAVRSTLVVLQNHTDSALQLGDVELADGVWTIGMTPPAMTPAQGSGTWQSESATTLTGTEGSVVYVLEGVGEVAIGWDNPLVGSNQYPTGCPEGFTLTQEGGGGNNATVTFTLAPAASG